MPYATTQWVAEHAAALLELASTLLPTIFCVCLISTNVQLPTEDVGLSRASIVCLHELDAATLSIQKRSASTIQLPAFVVRVLISAKIQMSHVSRLFSMEYVSCRVSRSHKHGQ